MGASASKSGNHNESLGLMPSKNIYMSVIAAHKSLQVCSGPVSPVIIIHSSTQTPKQSDPCPRYPHNMSLQGGRQVLYLCHGNYASELSEVPLNPPKSPLSLSCWEVPCYCCSPGSGSCGLWPWATPIPCIIGRSHGSHIHLPSLLTRRHGYRWISGKIYPCIWVILDSWDLSRQPRKKVIVEDLCGPSTTLSRQQCYPSAHCGESRQMSSYCSLRTKTWNSLIKE